MKGLKSFDFFQKIAVDNVTQPTIIGSLLSISAISLIAFLLMREFVDLLTPSIKRDTIVYHDPDQRSKINVNLGIRFNNIPCHMISVDQEDSVGNHRMDIMDTLNKIRIQHNGVPVKDAPLKGFIEMEKVVKAVTDKEGCLVEGFVPISKVPGDIHVSHHNYADIFEYLKYERSDLFSKLTFSHKINQLTFGEKDLNDRILSRFGFSEDSGFNSVSNFPNYDNDSKCRNYDYFIKLIPHLFVDKTRDETYTGYKYSMTSRFREYDASSNEMPILLFHYDLSPITMKYTLESKSFAHSLTHICAIVGGVYVIFSIFNRLLLAFCDMSSEKKGVGASG